MAEPTKYIATSAFEPTDLGEGFIWGVVGLCLAVLLLCGLAVVWLYPYAMADRSRALPLPVYPNPRLQPDPAADMRRYQVSELKQLNTAGWNDPQQQIAHIPISTAMQQIAREGIPGWPTP